MFVVEFGILTFLTHGAYVLWAVFEKDRLGSSLTYYWVGGVGLSGLTFATMVLSGCTSHDRRKFNLVGLPKKILWAFVLLLNHTSTPSKGSVPISLPCHVAGVGAGIAYSYLVLPVIRALDRLARGESLVAPERRRQRWNGFGIWALEFGIQVSLLFGVTSFCVMYAKRKQ